MGKYEGLKLTKERGVALLVLNRPEKLNALTPRMMWYEIPCALDELASDTEVRVLVITGEGRGFSSGADASAALAVRLKDSNQSKLEFDSPEPLGSRYGFIHHLRNLPKPTIAAVNGVAVGGGLSLALACDIRIASESARFGSVFVRRGLVPDMGCTFFLPRLIGTARALELMYTGDLIDAREAERIGLVNRVVLDDDLMKVTKELAIRIAKGPPIALNLTKRLVYRWLEQDLATQLDYEAYNQRLCFETEDFKEGVRAYQVKREPKFTGH